MTYICARTATLKYSSTYFSKHRSTAVPWNTKPSRPLVRVRVRGGSSRSGLGWWWPPFTQPQPKIYASSEGKQFHTQQQSRDRNPT